MTTNSVYLPLDLTGQSADNYVSLEYHQIPSNEKTILRPHFGAFFRDRLQLFGVSTASNMSLMRLGVDYELGELDEKATAKAGKEVWQVLLVKDTRFFTTFRLDYQALGGPENINYTRLYRQFQKAKDGKPTTWESLQNKPRLFSPSTHENDVKDIYGMEYVNKFIQDIGSALTSSAQTQAAYSQIRTKLREFESEMRQANSQLYSATRQHIDHAAYPHTYTKQGVGLGNVDNYGFVQISVAGVPQPYYAHPAFVKNVADNPTAPTAIAHAGVQGNLHQDTKASVGLGDVQNLEMIDTYNLGSSQYQTILAEQAPVKYLGPAAFSGAMSEAIAELYSTQILPDNQQSLSDIDDSLTAATAEITQAQSAVDTASSAAQSLIDASSQIDSDSLQAEQSNKRFKIVHGNSLYSHTLVQLLRKEQELLLRKANLYNNGFYPIPEKIDGLALWVSANNPNNTLLVDITGRTRVVKLVDASAYGRVYSAPAATAPILSESADLQDTNRISRGKVLRFEPGLVLDQLSGPTMNLRAGMTVIALVRSGPVGSHLQILRAPNSLQDTGIYAYTQDARQLSIRSGQAWPLMDAPTQSYGPDQSAIMVAVMSQDNKNDNWFASSYPLNFIQYPKGHDTAAGQWPDANWRSASLTQIGNPNFGINNAGELVELMIFNRALAGPEAMAVVEYLKTVSAGGLNLSVNFSALNFF